MVEDWLPRFSIKTLGPEGWRDVASAAEWHGVLLECAFAYWADGRCSVVVELEEVGGEDKKSESC